MMRTIRKFWLEPGLVIRGAEGEGDGDGGSGTGSGGDGSTGGDAGGSGDDKGKGNDGDADGDDDDDDDDDGEKETFSKEDVEGLRKALKEERRARKAAERANKAKEKTTADDAAKDEAAKAADRLKAAEDKAARLADGYRTARVESVITRLAQAAKVIDPSDMVALLKAQGYKDIDIDQDEEDPSDVEVDEDDVKLAIKKALKTRQHWIKSDDSDGDGGNNGRSGSKFTPNGSKKDKLDETALKDRYPALRNR